MTAARHASSFFLSYFFLSIPASQILNIAGMKKGIACSLLVMVAILIMGVADGAFVPRLSAVLKQRGDVQRVFLLLVPCRLYILYFASRGHRAEMRPLHRSRMMPAHFAD